MVVDLGMALEDRIGKPAIEAIFPAHGAGRREAAGRMASPVSSQGEAQGRMITGPSNGFALQPLGVDLARGLPFDTWLTIGQRLLRAHDSSSWWIGDWLAYGQWRYGEKYRTVVSCLGLSYDRIRDYAYVARNVPRRCRRADLSFSHHRLVARLCVDEQRDWLSKAAELQWTKRQFADALVGHDQSDETAVRPATCRPLNLSVEVDQLESWRQAAERAGMPLAPWAKQVLNVAAASDTKRGTNV